MDCFSASQLHVSFQPFDKVIQRAAGPAALLSSQYYNPAIWCQVSVVQIKSWGLFLPARSIAFHQLHSNFGLSVFCHARLGKPLRTSCAAKASLGSGASEYADNQLEVHVSELANAVGGKNSAETSVGSLESVVGLDTSVLHNRQLAFDAVPNTQSEKPALPLWHCLRQFSVFALAGIVLAVAFRLQLPRRISFQEASSSFVQTLTKPDRSFAGHPQVRQEEPSAIVPVALTLGYSQAVASDIPAIGRPSEALTQRRRRSLATGVGNPVVLVAASISEAPSVKINEKDLKKWLDGLREEARQRGVGEDVIKRALRGARPVPQVIEKDRNQPEFKLTFEAYMQRMVTDHRLKLGVDRMQKHGPLLKEVSAKYGVPEAIIVAIWGMESSYGNFMGTWDVVAALVTLAYDKGQPARAKYFREELINSLLILQDGHIGFDTMRGSWAGAMGQCQFMPSSFRNYAVDFDGDGKADIWTSTADVLASIANYLEKHGWKAGVPYFEKVAVSGKIELELLGLKVQKPAGEWRETHGVTPLSETPVLPADCSASLVAVDDAFYLASHNVSVVLRYNKSIFYALAVGHIAQSIESSVSVQSF